MSEFSDDEPPVNVSPMLEPDEDAALEHLVLLFGRAHEGKIEITGLHTDRARVRTKFFNVDDLEEAVAFAISLNRQPGWGLYVGAALRRPETFGDAAGDDDFLRTYAIWADADNAEQVASAKEACRVADLRPPFVVVTGKVPTWRAHYWWPLETPIDDIDTIRAAARGLAIGLGTDKGVCTGKQLMRLAGTLAWPKPEKEGRVLERVEIHKPVATQEFPLERITRAFPPVALAATSQIADVVVAPTGALGLSEIIMDGREKFAFRLVRGTLRQFIGENGAAPTPDELYAAAAPRFFARVDQVRPGRGPAFLKQKCAEAVRTFSGGHIPGLRSLEEGVINWAARQRGEPAETDPDESDDDYSPAAPDIFETLSLADIKALPDAEWTVDDILPKAGLGFVYGAPGSYKTFICYDLALSLAYGLKTWLDKPIQHAGSVLYIAAEGSSGFKNRISAWQAKRGLTHDDARFRLIRKSLSFMSADDVGRLDRTVAHIVETHGPVDTVFVDTVSRVLPGADENLQKDMTIFVAACDRIREKYGATVVGVHHTNKNGDMRGSTVFIGQGDFILRVDKNDEGTGGVVTCEKQKDAEDGWKRPFVIERLEWSVPGRIKLASSLVVNFDGDLRLNETPAWPARETCREMQRLIQDAWVKGRPWSPHKRTASEGKYAVRNLSEVLQMRAETVELVIDKWLSNEVVIYEIVDNHRKVRGLKVVKWLD